MFYYQLWQQWWAQLGVGGTIPLVPLNQPISSLSARLDPSAVNKMFIAVSKERPWVTFVSPQLVRRTKWWKTQYLSMKQNLTGLLRTLASAVVVSFPPREHASSTQKTFSGESALEPPPPPPAPRLYTKSKSTQIKLQKFRFYTQMSEHALKKQVCDELQPCSQVSHVQAQSPCAQMTRATDARCLLRNQDGHVGVGNEKKFKFKTKTKQPHKQKPKAEALRSWGDKQF